MATKALVTLSNRGTEICVVLFHGVTSYKSEVPHVSRQHKGTDFWHAMLVAYAVTGMLDGEFVVVSHIKSVAATVSTRPRSTGPHLEVSGGTADKHCSSASMGGPLVCFT
jgi:hypothetical protein